MVPQFRIICTYAQTHKRCAVCACLYSKFFLFTRERKTDEQTDRQTEKEKLKWKQTPITCWHHHHHHQKKKKWLKCKSEFNWVIYLCCTSNWNPCKSNWNLMIGWNNIPHKTHQFYNFFLAFTNTHINTYNKYSINSMVCISMKWVREIKLKMRFGRFLCYFSSSSFPI